jgi:hypothetical protein
MRSHRRRGGIRRLGGRVLLGVRRLRTHRRWRRIGRLRSRVLLRVLRVLRLRSRCVLGMRLGRIRWALRLLLRRRHHRLRGIREVCRRLRILVSPVAAARRRSRRSRMRRRRRSRRRRIRELLGAVLHIPRLRVRDARRLVARPLLGGIVAPAAHGHGVGGRSGGHILSFSLHAYWNSTRVPGGCASSPNILLFYSRHILLTWLPNLVIVAACSCISCIPDMAA